MESDSMIDTTNPDQTTDGARLDEVANILATGLLRLRSRRLGREKEREFSSNNRLAVPPDTSPHAIDL